MDDRSLVEAALGGDLDAFNQVVLRYQDTLYQQAYYLMRDRETAEDITQEALIKAFRGLRTYHGGSLRSWLLRILINTGIDELRRLKRNDEVSLVQTNTDGEEIDVDEWLADPAEPIEDVVEQAELSEVLLKHLKTLPEKYCNVVVLVDVQGLDYSETADVLGIPIGTVKSRLARARVQLHDRLATFQAQNLYALA